MTCRWGDITRGDLKKPPPEGRRNPGESGAGIVGGGCVGGGAKPPVAAVIARWGCFLGRPCVSNPSYVGSLPGTDHGDLIPFPVRC
jgi:hypothetical protein